MTDTTTNPRLFSRDPAERRAFREELGAGIGRFIPPELRSRFQFLAEMTPSAAVERAGQASQRVFDADRTAMDRVGDFGTMLSETAGVAAPFAVATRAAMPAAEAAQEALLGFSVPARAAAETAFERLNQPGPMPEVLYSNPPFDPMAQIRALGLARDNLRRAESPNPDLVPRTADPDVALSDFAQARERMMGASNDLSFGELQGLIDAQAAARRGVVEALSGAPSVRLFDRNDRAVVVGPGMGPGEDGRFRVTYFDADREPTNHTVFETKDEALNAALREGFVSRTAARGPSEAGATSSPAGIRVFHASPDQIEGDFRVSDRDVGLHFANNPDLAQNAAVKSALERPDTVGSIRPQEFVINATPEQVADIPASSNRFDFYDILESLREDGRIDQGLFDEIYDGLEEIEGSVSNAPAMMQEQNRFFSERLSRDADIKALRYYNEFDAGPTWADFEQGRESSSVAPDYSYIVLDPSAVKRPENFAQGGAVMMRSGMPEQIHQGVGSLSEVARRMFGGGPVQYMQAGGLALSMQEAQSPAFRTKYEDDFFVNSPLGYAAYEDGTPFPGEAGKWAQPAAPMEEMLRSVRGETGAPERSVGSGDPQNVQDLIQIFDFLQRKPASELTEQERLLLEEIPQYLSMRTGM